MYSKGYLTSIKNLLMNQTVKNNDCINYSYMNLGHQPGLVSGRAPD